MDRGWQYRVLSVAGTALFTVAAVLVTNLPPIHMAFSRVPYFGRPAPQVLVNGNVWLATVTALVVVLGSMWPLFKPRPRRILDTLLVTQKRVMLAMIGLAALGYFNYTYRLPRTTLMLTTLALLVTLPPYMIAIRRQPEAASRAIIIGDDAAAMAALLETTDLPVVGYVSPAPIDATEEDNSKAVAVTQSGKDATGQEQMPYLGGMARIEDVLVNNDVDTALLAFARTDRQEFFGTLELCYSHGVKALAHPDHADHVLTGSLTGTELLQIDLEPWDWQDYILKRLFDIGFATVAIVLLSPVIAVICAAIKLDDGGPILYRQERTATFGTTFTIYKFRSMTPETENTSPDSGEEYRITRVGSILRDTHLDEIPQLWAILTGKMSVVGPRAVWTDEEVQIEEETAAWRKRWFIKPGLTGLAQINDVTSAEAEDKLGYDLKYIRQQSFWFDLKIVVRQLWCVGRDLSRSITHRKIVMQSREEVDGKKSDEKTTEAKSQATDGDDVVAGRPKR